MGRRGTTVVVALATLVVACVLLFDPLKLGISDCLDNFVDSTSAVGAVIVGVPNFFLGYVKVPVNRQFFSNKRNKPTPTGKNRVTELEVFKEREAKLNRAIFLVLGYKEPQTTREIFKKINKAKGRRHFSYSIVNRRVRNLEQQLYIKKPEVQQRPGGITNYYELRPKRSLSYSLIPQI